MASIDPNSVNKLRDTISTARTSRVEGITIKAYDAEQVRELARLLDQSGCNYSVMNAPADLDDLYAEFSHLAPEGDPDDRPTYMLTVSGSLDELRGAVKLMESASKQ